MTRCFNGHRTERPGCVGCHHAHHVVEPGKVADGGLIPPVVRGPLTCSLCHEARHLHPVVGCAQCDVSYKETVRMAMEAAEPIRQELWGLRFQHWFVGWQARMAGWFWIIAGSTIWDWFERPDGSYNWLEAILSFASVPLVQWPLRKAIERRERMLPSLGPHGEIVYGADPD